MVALKVFRDSGYADRSRAYSVIVDGKKIGELRNGESKDFFVDPGEHEISMKIDWCGSGTLRFSAAKDEALLFRASSSLRGLRLLLGFWYVLVARSSYLRIEQIQTGSSSS